MTASATQTPASLAFDEDIDLVLAEKSLRHFVRQAWHVVEPATGYVSGWHLDCICEHLEAVTRGELRDLIINIPPRHSKSLIVSVFWPVWQWLARPSLRLLYSSYSEGLSIRDALKSRRVIQSAWFQARWGHLFRLTSDQNAKSRYENDKTGYRLATSVSGANTGEGGDVIVADDPHNVKEAESVLVREGVLTWWDETMSSRGNDPKTAARVIVMQRVHMDDLTGHLLKTQPGVYHHLALPARYEPRVHPTPEKPEPYQPGDPQPHDDCPIYPDPRTEPGELLNPDRFDEESLRRLELSMGPYSAAGQLQQNPVPREGRVFSADWFRPLPPYIDTPGKEGAPSLRQSLRRVLYFDLAFSEKETADYTAGCHLGADTAEQHYLLGVWRERTAEPKLAESIADYICLTKPHLVGVEEGIFNRQKSVQDLVRQVVKIISRRGVAVNVVLVKVDTDKFSRAQLPAGRAKLGMTYADKAAPWWDGFERRLLAFPNGQHDDEVDAYSGATLLLIEKIGATVPADERAPVARQSYTVGVGEDGRDDYDPFSEYAAAHPPTIIRR